MLSTRKASEVFFGPLPPGQAVTFQARRYKYCRGLQAKPYLSLDHADHYDLWAILTRLYKEERRQRDLWFKEVPANRDRQAETSRENQVNKKRALIAACLERQTTLNYAECCRFTGCCYSTVKRVHSDLLFNGNPTQFVYPNKKQPEELAALDSMVARVQGSFLTITDMKRENPTFSRRWISRRLRQTRLRWLQLPKNRKNPPKKEPPNAMHIVDLVSHLTQAYNSRNTEVLYVDEVHFPLYQTAEKRWTAPELNDEQFYNRRRPDEVKLSVVAVCDRHGFVAIQVFIQDVSGDDFLFTLQKVIERFGKDTRVTVLADNASWHKSASVNKSKASKFIHFNVKGLYRANAIENAFSFVRAEFRKRPRVETLEEEARLLVGIFFHQDNQRRFLGIYRNHLRQLMLLLKANSSRLAHVDGLPEH